MDGWKEGVMQMDRDAIQYESFPRLVFATGFPRSGTTLLATKLSEIEGVAATPETRYFEEVVDARFFRHRQVAKSVFLSELESRLRLQDLHLDLKQVVETYAGKNVDRIAFFRHLMAAYAHHWNADIVLEKSPVHAYHAKSILKWFPDAKLVGITRDGRDALLSLRKTPWAVWSDRRYAADWVYRNRLLLEAQRLFPHRVRLIKFEDFVADVPGHVQALAQWAVGHAEAAKSAPQELKSTIPSWERGWKAKAALESDPDRANAWKADPGSPQLASFVEIAGDDLIRFGYEANASTALGRLANRLYQHAFPVRQFVRRAFVAVSGNNTQPGDDKIAILRSGSAIESKQTSR